MSKVNISMDDVVAVTQFVGTVIDRKILPEAEARKIEGPWGRLDDAIHQLQRKQLFDKRYPVQPVPVPVPQPVVESSVGNDAVVEQKLPVDDSNVEGVEETSNDEETAEKMADLSL